MAFGFAGAAGQVQDDLVAALVRKRQEVMQQAQLKLQQEQAQRLQEQADFEQQQTLRGNANDKAKVALSYLSPGEITPEQAAPIQGSDFAPALKTISGLSRRGMAGDLNSGTVAPTEDAGGQAMTVLQPTKAQEQAQGQKAALEQASADQSLPENIRRVIQLQKIGANVPASLLGEDPSAADARRQSNAVALEGVRHQNRLSEDAAQAAETRRTNAARPPSGGAAVVEAGDKFTADTAGRVISAIDEVMPKINNWTAGPGGALLRKIPGTAASNVDAQLATVVGNVAFNALQQMRAASKTGGALGAISEKELALLSSVEGSIRQDQSPANLKAQLQKIRDSMTRVQMAAGVGAPAPSHGGSGGLKILSIQEVP